MSVDRNRRRVLEGLSLLMVPGLAVQNAQCDVARAPRKGMTSRVIQARRSNVVSDSGVVDSAVLRELLGKAVAAAMGTNQPDRALGKLFQKSDVVGIKVNTLAGKHLSSHPALVRILAEWLMRVGVAEEHILVWDRSDRELEAAGFAINREGHGVRCYGTNNDYDWTPREWGHGASCFSRLVVSELTAIINVGMIKDHDLSGISAGIKNLYGMIHNPNRYHDNGCNPYLAELAVFPLIRNKVRLTVLDGLVAQCHGGPAYSERWAWPWGGVLVSTDPVAVDAVAYQVIELQRRKVGKEPLAHEGREPLWLKSCASLGLGENNLERIEVVEV